MKSPLDPKEEILTTTEEKNSQQIKENIFNDIDNLAADHDVTVSNTMIKITYKKALKEQNEDSNPEASSLGTGDITLVVKSPGQLHAETKNTPVFHSTSKQADAEKKAFVNGLDLSRKRTSLEEKDRKKLSKGSGSKGSSTGDGRRSSKVKKLENGVKKRKGRKRKASNTEVDVLSKCKRMKVRDVEKGGGELEERQRVVGKKPIMMVDPDLPSGWTRFIRTKNKGSAKEQYVVYVVNPQGKKFRFKWKLRKYLQKTNSSLDPDQFFFGLYKRPKSLNTSSACNGEDLPRSVAKKEETESFSEAEDEAAETNAERRELLLYDPELPFGWKRIIHSDPATGRKQVHIISPDGKIFRRRYRLHEYLTKHQFSHSLDRFYFGLYPKKDGLEDSGNNKMRVSKSEDATNALNYNKTNTSASNSDSEDDGTEFKESRMDVPNPPMYDDPNLPEGWKRFIKIRSCGESAGRMEVVIVSPDGRRHRTRKHLEHYLEQKHLGYKAKDFDFTVFGRSNFRKKEKEPEREEPETNDLSFLGKKKFTDKPVPELDIKSIKESVITPEGHLINAVTGLMLSSGLSTARNERRQRLPRKEHEKQLKIYLNAGEANGSPEGCEISGYWVERLVKCRSDFKTLEPDAVTAVAKSVQEFIKKLSLEALCASKEPGSDLRYEDLAEIVDRTEWLSFLKAIIPKKITFREFVKLNRPKQFLSFT